MGAHCMPAKKSFAPAEVRGLSGRSDMERRWRRQQRRQRSHEALHNRGWAEVSLQKRKRWDVIDFVEQAHAEHHERVLAELESVRSMWDAALNPDAWWEQGH